MATLLEERSRGTGQGQQHDIVSVDVDTNCIVTKNQTKLRAGIVTAACSPCALFWLSLGVLNTPLRQSAARIRYWSDGSYNCESNWKTDLCYLIIELSAD